MNKSGSHGAPNTNSFNLRFSWSILVKVLCSSANELQQNSNAFREDYIYSTNIGCFVRDPSRLHLTFAAFCLSFVNKN